jgi:hypothetical protein
VEVPEGVKREAVDPSAPIAQYGFSMGAANKTVSRRMRGSGAGIGTGSGGGAGGGGFRNTYPSPPNAPPAVSVTASPRESLGTDQIGLVGLQDSDLKRKLHRSLLAVVQKLQKKEMLLNPAETPFIRDGKAEVQVWLTDKSSETLTQLKELGFEVVLDAKNSKLIVGRLPIEKLEALAQLKFVKYVAPQQ